MSRKVEKSNEKFKWKLVKKKKIIGDEGKRDKCKNIFISTLRKWRWETSCYWTGLNSNTVYLVWFLMENNCVLIPK